MARHTSASVRIAAIRVLQGLCERNGEEYLAYIPEMMPTVAELLDGTRCAPCEFALSLLGAQHPSSLPLAHFHIPDDTPDVERQTKRWVSTMENITGEPLQNFF